MKIFKISTAVLLFTLAMPVFAEEEEATQKASISTEDYKTILVSGTDAEKTQALKHFAEKKDKSQIPAIITLLNESENPAIASEAAITLGVIGKSGESTTALKKKIESTENGDIVYACVLAIFNIHRKDEKRDPEAEAALRFALENRRQDPFVVDILEKLKSKFIEEENKKKEAEKA
jgi:hypothetical protein